MSIRYVSHAAADATTVAISDYQVGDIAIVHAMRAASGPPSLPAGWTSITTVDQSGARSRWGYKFLTTETDIGTWTNAENVQVNIYRGVRIADPIGNVTGGAGNSTTIQVTANTADVTDGTSMILCMYGHDVATTAHSKSMTGMTTRSSGHTPTNLYAGDTNIGAVSIALATDTINGSGGWSTATIELQVETAAPAEIAYGWSVIAGALPTGLSLAAATGIISGTPTVGGKFTFTVSVGNNYFTVDSFECSIYIGGAGLPETTWTLDFARFQGEGERIWHKASRTMSRPAIVGDAADLVYTDATKNVYRINKTAVPIAGAIWESPSLNRVDRQEEVTLQEVGLRYTSTEETELIVEASRNGGIDWISSDRFFTELQETQGEFRRAKITFEESGITGYDVRFRVRFLTTGLVHIFSYQALFADRDNVFTE